MIWLKHDSTRMPMSPYHLGLMGVFSAVAIGGGGPPFLFNSFKPTKAGAPFPAPFFSQGGIVRPPHLPLPRLSPGLRGETRPFDFAQGRLWDTQFSHPSDLGRPPDRGQLGEFGGVDGNQMSSKGAAVENGLDRKDEMRHHLRFQDVSLRSIRQTSQDRETMSLSREEYKLRSQSQLADSREA